MAASVPMIPMAVVKPNEMEALLRALEGIGWEVLPDSGFAKTDDTAVMATLIGGDGNVDAALAVRDLLLSGTTSTAPIFFGCCGSLPGLDPSKPVVVGETVYCELGQVQPSGDGTPRVVLKPDHFLRHAYQAGVCARAAATKFQLKLARCYSSEKVVKVGAAGGGGEWPRHDQLLAGWENDGRSVSAFEIVDMESFGALRAAGVARWRLVILRVPSDALTDKSDQDDEGQITAIQGGVQPHLAQILKWCAKPILDEAEVNAARCQIWSDFLDTAARRPTNREVYRRLIAEMLNEYRVLHEMTDNDAAVAESLHYVWASKLIPSAVSLRANFEGRGMGERAARVASVLIYFALDKALAAPAPQTE